MLTAHHHRRRLAAAPGVEVDACCCGAIHLTIGALTLRLEPGSFERVVATLVDAADHRAHSGVGDRGWARLPS